MRTTLGFDIVVTKRMSTKVKIGAPSSKGCHQCRMKTNFYDVFLSENFWFYPTYPTSGGLFDPLSEIRF